jgi:inorganic pyrophosphatase
MSNLYELPIHVDSPRVINAVIEIPKGTSAKYEYDNELALFRLDRCLVSAMTYPASYGFIPKTSTHDGDALDVVVFNATPLDRGTLVECNVVDCLDMEDNGDKDYKILACPVSHVKEYARLSDIDPMFLKVAENFFNHYKDLDINESRVTIKGWMGRQAAYDVIKESIITEDSGSGGCLSRTWQS